jgi:hypothetical protein
MSQYISTLSERQEDIRGEKDIEEVENKTALSCREIAWKDLDNVMEKDVIDLNEDKCDDLKAEKNEKEPYYNKLNIKESDFDEDKSDKKIFDDNSNDSIGDDDDNPKTVLSPATVTESYLPSWVLKMRNKINESRLEHAKAESRIDSLHLSISNLDFNLQTLRNLTTTAIKLADVEKFTNVATYSFFLHHLPTDLIGTLLDYYNHQYFYYFHYHKCR